ncbi:MAG TPA: hydroxymyristoyl-ACP dehydratase [Gallionella sp.]|nr:hydroxymyristoyl-ACP dehydratase [Gallionella sp.]
MLIDQHGIRALIPHSGEMCLLAGVLSWDATRITCIADSHRSATNPLRSHGKLPALCGIEYAAQAMAAHGALSGLVSQRPRAGLLISVREVVARVARLDDVPFHLLIEAEQLLAGAGGVSYRFALRAGEAELLSGRATVVLDAEETAL